MAGEASIPHLNGYLVYLGAFKHIWTHLDYFRLIKALFSLFRLIWAHLSSCITGKNLVQIEPHSEDAYLYKERELRLINLNVLQGGRRRVGLPPPSPTQGTSYFPWLVFWAPIQFEFTYIKWTNKKKLWWAIITNKTIKLKICIQMWPTVAWLQ